MERPVQLVEQEEASFLLGHGSIAVLRGRGHGRGEGGAGAVVAVFRDGERVREIALISQHCVWGENRKKVRDLMDDLLRIRNAGFLWLFTTLLPLFKLFVFQFTNSLEPPV